MFWDRLSVSTKLFAIIGVVSALVILFLAVMVTINMRSGFTQYLAQAELARFDTLETRLTQIHDGENPGWPQFNGDRAAWHRFVRDTIPPPPGTRPVPRERSDGRQASRLRPPPDPLRLGSRLALLEAGGTFVVGGDEDDGVFAKRPIRGPAGVSPPLGWIALTAPPARMEEGDRLFLADQARTLAMTAFLGLALSVAAAYLFSRQFLQPVRDIARSGEELARGNYTVRLRSKRSDELGSLMDQFNDLAETLETAEQAERKWVSDTAHELKTPVAILQAQIEALQDGVRQPDKDALALLHASTERLAKLIADLNTLATARESAMAVSLQRENLSMILEEAADAIRPALREENLALETSIEPALDVLCDRTRIRQVIDNLLQNAKTYTRSPGEIRLRAARRTDFIEIRIDDTAPAPPQEDMAKLFDRFFRCEQSRDRRYGGSGLGLSICREIVQGHAGSIAAEHSPLGGLAIVVKLPLDEVDHG